MRQCFSAMEGRGDERIWHRLRSVTTVSTVIKDVANELHVTNDWTSMAAGGSSKALGKVRSGVGARREPNTSSTTSLHDTDTFAVEMDIVAHSRNIPVDNNISMAAFPAERKSGLQSTLATNASMLYESAGDFTNSIAGNFTSLIGGKGSDTLHERITNSGSMAPRDTIARIMDSSLDDYPNKIQSMALVNESVATAAASSFHQYFNESWWNCTNRTCEMSNDSEEILDGLPPGFPYPYPSEYTWVHIILAAIAVTVIIIFIIVGNAMVIIAIAQDRNLNQVQNFFIGSLALSDLLLGLLIMPLSLANELMGYWYFGDMLCDMWLSVDVLLCTASILNLCLISLDRYWSVTQAMSYVRKRTRKRAIIMITLVWLLSAMICFPPLVGWKRPQPKIFGLDTCVLSEEIGYVVYSTMGSFYVPLTVMVVVYFKIYLAARTRARRNLKKKMPLPAAPTNGKSTSSSTTTSFNQQTTRGVNTVNTVVRKDSFSDEGEGEDDIQELPPASEIHEADLSGTNTDSFDPDKGQGIKLCVTNHNAHFKPIDEKRKLLSEDTDCTDSTCDTPVKRTQAKLGDPKHIQFSDTDSDYYYNKYTEYNDSSGGKDRLAVVEENLKPLLEDSQAETESQRESDKNGNKLQTDTETAEDEHRQPAVPEVVPSVQVDSSSPNPPKPASNAQTPNNKDGQSTKRHSGKKKLHSKSNGPNDNGSLKKKMDLLSPNSIRKLSLKRHAKDKPALREDPDRFRRKIARAKERRAILVLGIIMVTFIICWLPFFSLYLVSILFGLNIDKMVFAVIFWAGYCNSALNPIIYTIFNREFRQAFTKMICHRRFR